MEEQLFPSPFAKSPDEIEEERRLFYVAITRAEENCFISYSKSRFRNGQTNFSNPSRFLKDIDNQYLEYIQNEVLDSRSTSSFNRWDDDIEIERNRFRQTPFRSARSATASSTQQFSRKLMKINSADDDKKTVDNARYPVGSFVKHAIFGIGKVIETSISNGNEKAEIDFGEKGVKSLLLKFAKLEKLD
jgi:DNA helicase-2/ATP-dependent DNA helicase PcrA